MIKFHLKYFIEFIPYDEVSPEKIRQNFKNINNIDNNLTRFQFYPETELACKYNTRKFIHPSKISENCKKLVENLDHKTKAVHDYKNYHL